MCNGESIDSNTVFVKFAPLMNKELWLNFKVLFHYLLIESKVPEIGLIQIAAT